MIFSGLNCILTLLAQYIISCSIDGFCPFSVMQCHFALIAGSSLSYRSSIIACISRLTSSTVTPFCSATVLRIAYATNDIVLIVLWTLASLSDTRYISVVICFAVFLFNDIYSFFCWQRMKQRQSEVISDEQQEVFE